VPFGFKKKLDDRVILSKTGLASSLRRKKVFASLLNWLISLLLIKFPSLIRRG
jgi:hypothetical protein